MMDAWDDVAILRQCRRCGEWMSLLRFRPGALLCEDCWYPSDSLPTQRHVPARGYALTGKGREFLAAERAAA